MPYVYILKSQKDSSRTYIGKTVNVQQRLEEHNRGESPYTKTFTPWKLQTFIWFEDTKSADDFEKYLKSGSGFAFMKKRLLPK